MRFEANITAAVTATEYENGDIACQTSDGWKLDKYTGGKRIKIVSPDGIYADIRFSEQGKISGVSVFRTQSSQEIFDKETKNQMVAKATEIWQAAKSQLQENSSDQLAA